MRASLQARGDFALEVGPHLLPHLLEVAVRDAERAREVRVQRWQHGLLDFLDRRGELGGPAGQGLGRVVRREGHVERLLLSLRHTGQRRLELRQHAALSEGELEVGRTAALECHPVDGSGEIKGHDVVGVRPSRRIDVLRPLATHDLERAVDLGFTDRAHSAPHLDAGQIGERDLRIHLEGRRERQIGAAIGGTRFDLRRTRNTQLAGTDCRTEGLADLVVQHFRLHLRAVGGSNHLHRHLARPEAGHLDVARELREPRLHFLLDRSGGNREIDTTLEGARGLQRLLHGLAFLDCRVHAAGQIRCGAKGGTRTPTPVKASGPKPGASTNFATFAPRTHANTARNDVRILAEAAHRLAAAALC